MNSRARPWPPIPLALTAISNTGATMSNLHSFPILSWSDVYQRLRTKAKACRGVVALYPSITPDATFPHTTSRDAFAIALVFDAAVNDHASRALLARWIGESDLLAGEP